VAVLGSFVLRLNLGPRLADFKFQILAMILIALIIKPLVYYQFGLYRRLWIYAGTQELKLIGIAVITATILVSVVVIILSLTVFEEFPRSVLIIDFILSLIAVGGIRFSLRILSESQTTLSNEKVRTRRVLIVGAGDAGALVVREMQKNPQENLLPICFVDDAAEKQNQEIHGIPVLGTLDDIADIINTNNIDEVIIAIPGAPGQVVRKVTEICHQKNIPSRTMPSIHELIGGRVSVNRLREVNITDLLRREPTHIDDALVGSSLGNRIILVTGAGGSIGRELCRQVARWNPTELIILGHGENSIFESLLELEQSYPSLTIHPVIADIRDGDRLLNIFDIHKPQVVFHAAAHKHLPLMQTNVEEAVTNNVLGTRNVVQVSIDTKVERLVEISTDKAICPTSVYGATKRLGELLVLDAAKEASASFSVVRFGNVLGSRGSVLLLFKQQIDSGGPVTVTHPDMQRYFMTIPEAVHLVLQASAMGKGGDVFVLNMGEQVRILDLAEDYIRLSGLEPRKDIEIVFTGIRPGEKLSETLWDEGADYKPTSHPDILRLDEDEFLSGIKLNTAVDDLIDLAQKGDVETIIQKLDNMIPGASVESAPPHDITAII
jgi:FlaA1/EpsC-like NDP-sugar epimerase